MLARIKQDRKKHRFRAAAADDTLWDWWLAAYMDGRWSTIAQLGYPSPPDRWLVMYGWLDGGAFVVASHETIQGADCAHQVWLDGLLGRCAVSQRPGVS
jgi:hypothetical protein